MTEFLQDVARELVGSPANQLARHLLIDVPGFAPVAQTIHLLAISAVMGSIVLIDLRVLGLALPSQSAPEMIRRLMPWTWWALPVLAITGLTFVFGRPNRYLVNPVFGLKFAMLVPAIVLGVIFHRAVVKDAGYWEVTRERRLLAKLVAAVSLTLWVGVVMAGRWIAYADYIFPPE